MKTVNNADEAFRLQHNGIFYDVPAGFSELPEEVALHAQRKFATVRVQYPQGELPPALRRKATETQEPEAETQPQTPAEVSPEQPAEPIEGEPEQTPAPEPPAEAQE